MDLLRPLVKLLTHCVKVGRFFGIAVRIHWSFWALPLGLGLATLSQGPVNAGLMVLLVLVFYAQGVVLHEYGHALSARAYGVKTRDIILTPIGGIARMEEMPDNPVEEIVIALCGPAVNVVFAVGMFFLLVILQRPPSPTMMGQQHMTSWSDFAWWLTFLNVFMAGFNLLPAFPSDGGRVFRAFLSLFVSRLAATKVAVYTGAVMALGLAIIGIGVGIVQLPFIAVLFAFIGQMELWMLRRQADLRGQAYAESMRLSAERSAALEPPEPDFSGYSWDADSRAWVEWRNGVAVRKCRMRVG